MARLQSVNHNLTDQRIRVTLKGHNSLEMHLKAANVSLHWFWLLKKPRCRIF